MSNQCAEVDQTSLIQLRKPVGDGGKTWWSWKSKPMPVLPEVNGSKPFHMVIKATKLHIPASPRHVFDEPFYTTNHSATPAVTVYTRTFAVPGIDTDQYLSGPTIRLRPGDVLNFVLENQLEMPDTECVGPKYSQQHYFCHPNHTNVHVHGLHVSPKEGSDNVFENIDPVGLTNKTMMNYSIRIPDNHMGGTFWYHAHHHHSTALQAGGGAFGAIIIEDPEGTLPEQVATMPERLVLIAWLDVPEMEQFIVDDARGNLWQHTSGEQQSIFEGALINGKIRPTLDITENTWYRFRIVYADVSLSLQITTPGDECELQLLAKDGVYLHVAPRKVPWIALGPGNRADVAVKCTCPPGTGRQCSKWVQSRKDQGDGSPFHGVRMYNVFTGGFEKNSTLQIVDLFKLNIKKHPQGHVDPPLQKFRLARPCYLVDLRNVEELTGEEVHKHTLGMQVKLSPGGQKGPQDGLITLDGNGTTFQHASPLGPPMAVLPLETVQEFNLTGVGDYPDGPSGHPYHQHVTPYQLQDLEHPDIWFQNGDWHDTFIRGGQDHVKVRFQLTTFTGNYVTHCHILTHEDSGMMNYFQVEGKEGNWWEPSKKIDPNCYESAQVRNDLKEKKMMWENVSAEVD